MQTSRFVKDTAQIHFSGRQVQLEPSAIYICQKKQDLRFLDFSDSIEILSDPVIQFRDIVERYGNHGFILQWQHLAF